MKTKFIFMIVVSVLFVLPVESFAFWGKKKKKEQAPPENAYSILLQTNNVAKTNAVIAQPGYVPDALGHKPAPKKHKTAAQQLADVDKLRVDADKANDDEKFDIAVELYDKAIKAYNALQEQYPDLQPAAIEFNRNHCVYQFDTILKGLKKGSIKVNEVLPSEENKPTEHESGSVLSKARMLMEEGNDGAARELLMRTLMNDPDNEQIRIAIGIVQVRLHWYDDASFLLETLVSEHPEDVDAHVVLAAAYTGLERYKDAELQLQKTLELNPLQKEANFNMAKLLYATAPQEKDKIIKYYTKAVELGVERDAQLDAVVK